MGACSGQVFQAWFLLSRPNISFKEVLYTLQPEDSRLSNAKCVRCIIVKVNGLGRQWVLSNAFGHSAVLIFKPNRQVTLRRAPSESSPALMRGSSGPTVRPRMAMTACEIAPRTQSARSAGCMPAHAGRLSSRPSFSSPALLKDSGLSAFTQQGQTGLLTGFVMNHAVSTELSQDSLSPDFVLMPEDKCSQRI